MLKIISVAQQTIDASDILQDIKDGKAVNISNATIRGVLDLTYMNDALPKLPKRKKKWWNNGGSNEIEKLIESKISFVNCKFIDDVLAYIPHEDSGYTFTADFEDICEQPVSSAATETEYISTLPGYQRFKE